MKHSYELTEQGKKKMLSDVAKAFDKAANTRAYRFDVKTVGKGAKRSQRANSYLWGVVYATIAQHINSRNREAVTPEAMHEFCKQKFGWMYGDVGTVELDGVPIFTKVSTASMDSEQFWGYVDAIRDWFQGLTGELIPLPNEAEKQDIDNELTNTNEGQ